MTHYGRNLVLGNALVVAEKLGLDSDILLKKLEISRDTAERKGGFVRSGTTIDAIELGASLTGRSDFGLMMGRQADYRTYGAIAAMMSPECTVAEALEEITRAVSLLNSGIELALHIRGAQGEIRFQAICHSRFPPYHYAESQILVLQNLCRLLNDSHWQPQAVHFMHRQMSPLDTYRREFACEVLFGKPHNAVIVPRDTLKRRITVTETPAGAMMQKMLDEVETRHPEDLPAQIAVFIPGLLLSGHATAEHIAPLVGMPVRTLQRRLADEGTSLKQVILDERLRITRSYLQTKPASRERLARLLGFSEASAASRFMREQMK